MKTAIGMGLSMVWLCSVMPGSALAQLGSSDAQVQISADTLQARERESRLIYLGNVDVTQGDARLRADNLTINFQPGTDGQASGVSGSFDEIETMVATGDVFYITPDLRARGDEGIYTRQTDTVFLKGNVVITRGEDNVAKGDCLTLELSSGVSTLGCGDEIAADEATSRVVTVINTQSSETREDAIVEPAEPEQETE